VVIAGGTPSQPALLSLTVAGAAVGVRVDGGRDVELRNVILRDNKEAGLRVLANATASLISGTVLRNAVGIDVEGTASVRDTLITANAVGLSAGSGGMITTTYSNVAENTTADRRGVDLGNGDLSVAVQFVAANDSRLAEAQGTTDHGDPADAFDQEPQPNGNRINIGAFGNTPFAELSVWSTTPVPQNGADAAPVAPVAVTPAPVAVTPAAPSVNGDGGCAVAMGRPSGSDAGSFTLIALAIILVSGRWRQRQGPAQKPPRS
jgi:hypothetical protein